MDRSNDIRGLERRKLRQTPPVQETPVHRIASSTRLGTVEPDQRATTSNQTVPFPLPPTEEVKIYMNNYFGIFNTGMPLFDPLEFQTYFGQNTSENIKEYCQETESRCIANAKSAISKFVCEPPTVLNLQITLGLALVLMADQDPQSASNLIGMAVKMIYGLKLHLPSNRTVHYHTRHHHERIFWIAYIIDRDLSLITSEPYLLRDDEIGLNIKDIMCSEGTGNVRNDYYETIEILEPRAELAQIQGKLYDLVRSLKASKFSLTQKRSVEERLYRMLREWHKHLYEPRIDKNMYPGKPEELESRSHRLHEALLHLAYYRCLYSVANLSVSNRDWMQKLNDFSDRISLPVCEATVTVLAAHLITLPVRDLEETFPSDDDFIELKEMENDEYRLRGAIQHYGKFLHGIKDPQVLVHYSMFKELVSKAGQTVPPTSMEELQIKPSGIFMQQDFVTPEHEQKLVHIFENELEWPTRPGRLSLHYGYTFSYKTFGIDEETPFKPFPDWLVPLLPTTEGRPPDQVCLQQYAAGTGIPPHVDTHGPFDQLYSLSLGSALMMQFANKEKGEKIEVDLLPRSMMQMSGDSRLHWTHGIKSRKTDTLPDGTVRLRQLRWSLTYRWLRPGAECECGNEKLCDTAQRRNGVEREYRWKQYEEDAKKDEKVKAV
ncbi:unnamed protein product [Fusarium graminearum]|nr:unnamed protein product [Fusarium graminearum]